MISDPILLNPGSIARALGAVASLLILASTTGQLLAYMTGDVRLYGFVSLFNLDAENNVPTFFSVFLLLFSALLLSIITMLERKQAATDVPYWATLAFGFLSMAADELISFHERLIKPTRKLLGDDNLGVFYFSWVIIGIALIVVLAWFFLRFWLRLPANARRTFFMAAATYIGGNIGFEMIGGHYAEMHGLENLTYRMITTIEESLEMAGVIVFIRGLLDYIADRYKEVRIRFDGTD